MCLLCWQPGAPGISRFTVHALAEIYSNCMFVFYFHPILTFPFIPSTLFHFTLTARKALNSSARFRLRYFVFCLRLRLGDLLREQSTLMLCYYLDPHQNTPTCYNGLPIYTMPECSLYSSSILRHQNTTQSISQTNEWLRASESVSAQRSVLWA